MFVIQSRATFAETMLVIVTIVEQHDEDKCLINVVFA